MDKASLSPSSLTKHMFGDSADEVCEVLTPSQCVNSTEPARPHTWWRRCPYRAAAAFFRYCGSCSYLQHQYYSGMVPPSNSMPWGVGGPYSGTQGLPNFSNTFPGFNFTMPQHSAVPPWLHSQWTAMPYQGLGVAPPPMDRYWSFNQPQHG